jgi:hypothetical protein
MPKTFITHTSRTGFVGFALVKGKPIPINDGEQLALITPATNGSKLNQGAIREHFLNALCGSRLPPTLLKGAKISFHALPYDRIQIELRLPSPHDGEPEAGFISTVTGQISQGIENGRFLRK